MPLSEAQRIEIRALLNIRKTPTYYLPGKSAITILEEKLLGLNADQVTQVEEILSEYQKIKYDTGTLQGEYSDSPEQKRNLLKQHLVNAIDFNPADYQAPYAFKLERH